MTEKEILDDLEDIQNIEGGWFMDQINEDQRKYVIGKPVWWFDSDRDTWYFEKSCKGSEDKLYSLRKLYQMNVEDAEKMVEALNIIQDFNHINNDRDMYLHDIVIWALGGDEDITEKPKPEDYGIQAVLR